MLDFFSRDFTFARFAQMIKIEDENLIRNSQSTLKPDLETIKFNFNSLKFMNQQRI